MVSVIQGSPPPPRYPIRDNFSLTDTCFAKVNREDREPVSGGETRLAGGTTFFHITEHFGSAN